MSVQDGVFHVDEEWTGMGKRNYGARVGYAAALVSRRRRQGYALQMAPDTCEQQTHSLIGLEEATLPCSSNPNRSPN